MSGTDVCTGGRSRPSLDSTEPKGIIASRSHRAGRSLRSAVSTSGVRTIGLGDPEGAWDELTDVVGEVRAVGRDTVADSDLVQANSTRIAPLAAIHRPGLTERPPNGPPPLDTAARSPASIGCAAPAGTWSPLGSPRR